MTSFNFWYRWLLTVSVLNIFIGLFIAFAPDSFFFSLYTTALADTFFNGDLPEGASAMRTFFFGIIGGTLAGYFLLQTFIVWIPFYHRQLWSWHVIVWALILWFMTDSSLSIYHGALFNVWTINLTSLILIGLPLLMTYKDFQRGKVRNSS